MLIEKILDFSSLYKMLPDSGIVLVCVSGGADSMCLLEAMLHISHDRGFTVAAAHFNHGLRGEESDRDEAFVENYCLKCGVPFYPGRGDVALYAKNNRLSIETAARDMRYSFFYGLAETVGASRIATAHNADDNTETMLINLTRGAGANGLSGIPPVRGALIRPMLGVTRGEVELFLQERHIPFVEDSTNSDDVFTRNKIRHHIIPVLKEINPRLHEVTTASAQLLREDERMLSELADLFISDHCAGLTVRIGDLMNLPFSVSSRVIRKLYGGTLSYPHVKAVLELCQKPGSSVKLSLPGKTVYKDFDLIVFEPNEQSQTEGFEQIFPVDGDNTIILSAELKMSCKSIVFDSKMAKFNKTLTSFIFKSVDTYGKITVRPRHEGDRMKLLGHEGTKSLKKLFIERRIPARKRSFIPVIADSKGVLAVYSIGMGDRAIAQHGDLALQISFEPLVL